LATFLEMCRAVHRESGTTTNFETQPPSVLGQTGRNAKVVSWVRNAWTAIQGMHSTWLFLRVEFTGSLTIGNGEYTAGSLSLSDFAEWPNGEGEPDALTVYPIATGVADERALSFLPWDVFKRRYRRGEQANNTPHHWSVSPTNALCIGPAPDVAYTITGEHIRTPQILTEDDDVPICPAQFHDGIEAYALEYLAEHDERGAPALLPGRRRWDGIHRQMVRTQLPRITRRGAKMA
jgi:hypothetical protein